LEEVTTGVRFFKELNLALGLWGHDFQTGLPRSKFLSQNRSKRFVLVLKKATDSFYQFCNSLPITDKGTSLFEPLQEFSSSTRRAKS